MGKKILGYSELQDAYDLALENAQKLCQDATILCEKASYSHSYALSLIPQHYSL